MRHFPKPVGRPCTAGNDGRHLALDYVADRVRPAGLLFVEGIVFGILRTLQRRL
jgi:hypothetical protein